MGEHSPKHRAQEECYQKARRNDRILQRFYDAVYIDSRDGTLKKGRELTNGQINRSHKKDHENLHPFRGRKISKGRITVRRSRNSLKTGSLVTFRDEILIVRKTHARKRQDKQTGKWVNSVNVEFKYPARGGRKSAQLSEKPAKGKCTPYRHEYNTGWKKA